MLKLAGRLGSVGIEMGIAVGIGALGGWWLDKKFDTEPILMWVGLALGLGAATKAIVDAAMMARRAMDDDGDADTTED